MRPFAGLPTEGTGCAHSAHIDSPGCGQPAAVHMASETASWGLVSFATCDAHDSIARAAGRLVAEHPYGPACPDSTACWAGSKVHP